MSFLPLFVWVIVLAIAFVICLILELAEILWPITLVFIIIIIINIISAFTEK